jgi:predicted secreted Zn-dependent protease
VTWRSAVFGLALAAGCGPSPSALPSTPGVRATVDTIYYGTEGVTRAQWMASMRIGARRAGVPAPFLAHTAWQTRWTYGSSQLTARGCEARQPSVDLTISYTMPRLASDSGVAREDLAEWRRHLTSLWRHEEGHGLRAFRAAREMRDTLAHVRAPSCGALPMLLARSMDALLQKYRALQEGYDARTGHGSRQGAMLIPSGNVRLAADTTFRDTLP